MKNQAKIKQLRALAANENMSQTIREKARKEAEKLGNPIPEPKYKTYQGPKVYSYQNKDYPAEVARIRKDELDGKISYSYLLTLKREDGSTYSSKWVGENSLSDVPLTKTGRAKKTKGLKALLEDEPKENNMKDTDELLANLKKKKSTKKTSKKKEETKNPMETKNYRAFKISYVKETNENAAKTKIEDLRHKESKIIPFGAEYNETLDTAKDYLIKKGIPLIGNASAKDYYLLFTDNFDIHIK